MFLPVEEEGEGGGEGEAGVGRESRAERKKRREQVCFFRSLWDWIFCLGWWLIIGWFILGKENGEEEG